MNAIQRAAPVSKVEITKQYALGRQVLGNVTPPALGAGAGENKIVTGTEAAPLWLPTSQRVDPLHENQNTSHFHSSSSVSHGCILSDGSL